MHLLAFADQLDDLTVLRETIQRAFGEDQGTVDRDLEHAALRRQQLGLRAKGVLQLSRQTGGQGLVVSLGAVFDLDPHAVLIHR